MAGDRIHTSVDYYYTVTNANNTGAGGINSLAANFASAIGASGQVSGALKDGASGIASGLSGITALVNLLNTANNTSGANNAPKAYLNIIAFDDQFKYDATASTVIPVPYGPNAAGTISRLAGSAITVAKSGFIYVYVSNESDELVYFDNFILTHEKGPILEDTHYYPFGLIMAGLSSKALLKTENRYKFNDGTELASKEFCDGAGLDWYETSFQSYDPQIGRFHQIDPLAEIDDQFSPYAFGNNNPISFNNPLGLRPINLNKNSSSDVNSGGGGGGSSWIDNPYNREPTFKSYFEPSLNDAVNAAYHSPNGGEVTRNDQGRWGTNLYTAYEADQFVEYYKTTKEYKENRKSERTKLDDPTYGADYLEKVYVTAPEKELADPGNPMKTAMAVAIGLSIADGPLPIGEIIGGVIVLGTYTYVYWDDISNGWDRLFSKSRGERNQARNPDGTNNPFKKLRPDPNKPGNILEKNSHTGKTISKIAPKGFWEWWKNK